jgi:hypothetical protein
VKKIHNYLFLFIFLFPRIAYSADGLGRLFLTPDQRSQLETVRAQRDRRLPAAADPEAPPVIATPTGPDVVTYNGVVRRSDGKATVWINGKPLNERSKGKNDSEVSVLGFRRDGEVGVAIPQAGRTASLKVGQSLAVTSGRIEESYLPRETLPRAAEQASLPPVPIAKSNALQSPPLTTPATPPVRDNDTKQVNPENGTASAARPQ